MRFRKDHTSHQIRMSRQEKHSWIPALVVLNRLSIMPNVILYIYGRQLFKDRPIGGLRPGQNIGIYGTAQRLGDK